MGNRGAAAGWRLKKLSWTTGAGVGAVVDDDLLFITHAPTPMAISTMAAMAIGTIGAFFFPLAIYGAARIGKPGSPWASA